MFRSQPDGDQPDSQITTLDTIGPKNTCRIVSVHSAGNLRRRLLAMGIVPGTVVETIRAAPLGDPLEFRVRGYCLSLRRAEARTIDVVPEGM